MCITHTTTCNIIIYIVHAPYTYTGNDDVYMMNQVSHEFPQLREVQPTIALYEQQGNA